MPDVTIIIPVAPYHNDLLERAVRSANEQTVHCEVLVYPDKDMRGAGFARNKALAQVTTKFTIFLDADDLISPMFVERCMSVWKPGRYVYTDFYMDATVVKASEQPWQPENGEWHVITSLLRTEDVQKVGGFDENVAGAEDTLLYWALTRAGICGICVHEPLFTYGKEGRRAREFVNSPAYEPTMRGLLERYGDAMCCGGDGLKSEFTPDQPGDVEAVALWGGNRRERGPVTGRLYPRGGNLNPMSVNPQDIDAAPHLWQRAYHKPVPVQPAILAHERPQTAGNQVMQTVLVDGVGELVEKMYPGVKVIKDTPQVLTADDLKATLPKTALSANVKPDAGKVRRLAGKAKGKK